MALGAFFKCCFYWMWEAPAFPSWVGTAITSCNLVVLHVQTLNSAGLFTWGVAYDIFWGLILHLLSKSHLLGQCTCFLWCQVQILIWYLLGWALLILGLPQIISCYSKVNINTPNYRAMVSRCISQAITIKVCSVYIRSLCQTKIDTFIFMKFLYQTL